MLRRAALEPVRASLFFGARALSRSRPKTDRLRNTAFDWGAGSGCATIITIKCETPHYADVDMCLGVPAPG